MNVVDYYSSSSYPEICHTGSSYPEICRSSTELWMVEGYKVMAEDNLKFAEEVLEAFNEIAIDY